MHIATGYLTHSVAVVIHAEMPVHAEGRPDPRGLQLWVDLPKEVRITSYDRGAHEP